MRAIWPKEEGNERRSPWPTNNSSLSSSYAIDRLNSSLRIGSFLVNGIYFAITISSNINSSNFVWLCCFASDKNSAESNRTSIPRPVGWNSENSHPGRFKECSNWTHSSRPTSARNQAWRIYLGYRRQKHTPHHVGKGTLIPSRLYIILVLFSKQIPPR